MTGRFVTLVLAAATLGAGQPAGRAAQDPGAARLQQYIAVRSSVDRAAVWIGDRFTYTVYIGCSHGLDVLTDDLGRDRLRLDGLEVLALDRTREDHGDGVVVYRFAYRLATYRPEPATQRVADMSVRFYVRRAGQRPEDVAPLGEVVVPGATVAVRSLLPDARDTANFRSDQPPLPRAAVFGRLQSFGIAAVIVASVPVAFAAVALLGRVRQRRPRQSVRKLRHDEHLSLDAVRGLDVESESGRREAFDRLNALVRTHLSAAWGVSADGLTPAEIESALSDAGRADASALVVSLLHTCDRAKYGRPEQLPPHDACRAAIDQAKQLLATGRG